MDHCTPLISPTNPSKLCDVCGDVSTLYRGYGARACRGCIDFYRRCNNSSAQLLCIKGDNCVINKTTRRQCRSCRLRKCIEAGMKMKYIGSRQRRQAKAPEECTVEVEMPNNDSSLDDLSFPTPKIQNTSSTEESMETMKSEELCAVCGDSSRGSHYGAPACNGCKKFFNRNVTRQSLLRCKKRNECVINVKTRNRCQFCRLQKCLQVGMNPESFIENGSRKKAECSASSVLEQESEPVDSTPNVDPRGSRQDPEADTLYDITEDSSIISHHGAQRSALNYTNGAEIFQDDGPCQKTLGILHDHQYCGVPKCLEVWMDADDIGIEQGSQVEVDEKSTAEFEGINVLMPSVDVYAGSAPAPKVESKKANVLCAVCGDTAAGLNFGAFSCEGCKKFFHRNAEKESFLVCGKLSNCLVDLKNRKCCQFCRLQKCLQVGMSLENRYKNQSKKRKVEKPLVAGNSIEYDGMDWIEMKDSIPSNSGLWLTYDPLGKYLGNRYKALEPPSMESESILNSTKDQLTMVDSKKLQTENTVPDWNSPTHSIGPEWDSLLNSTPTLDSPDFETTSPEYTVADLTFPIPPMSLNIDSQYLQTTNFENIIRFHKKTCAYTMEKVTNLLERDLIPANFPTTNHLWAWHYFAPTMDLELREIFCFLENIGFLNTNQQQTVALLKNSAFKIYLLRVIRALFSQGMLLQNGRVVDSSFLNFVFGDLLAVEMLQISESMRKVILTDDQMALFIVMVLLESDPESRTVVKKIKNVLQKNAPNFRELMDLRPRLSYINYNFMNLFVPWLRANHQSIHLPDVFSEVFDIPRTSS